MTKREQKLSQELLRLLPQEVDKASFYQSVTGARHVLDVYRAAIEAKRTRLETVNEDEYECPSWSHKQAHRNGYHKAIEDMLRLFPRPEE